MKTSYFGGTNTKTGLLFEDKADLLSLFKKIPGYEISKIAGKVGMGVWFEKKLVARYFKKHDFYKFLEESGVNWKAVISRKLLPSNAILVIVRETLFIIEVEYQQVIDSIDEELMLCDFERKQYLKLVSRLGLKVEYIYILSDWFKSPAYKDVLDYIQSVNCHYKFNELPLAWLGLPTK